MGEQPALYVVAHPAQYFSEQPTQCVLEQPVQDGLEQPVPYVGQQPAPGVSESRAQYDPEPPAHDVPGQLVQYVMGSRCRMSGSSRSSATWIRVQRIPGLSSDASRSRWRRVRGGTLLV